MTALRLGLAGGHVPSDPALLTPAVAAELAGLGLRAVVTHFPLADLSDAEAGRIKSVLEAEGIAVVQAGGFRTTLVEPNPRLAELRPVLRTARLLGAEMFITGCGSLNPNGDFYGPSRKNHSATARRNLVENLREVGRWAEEEGLVIALECYLMTTLDTPENIAEVLAEVDSPAVRANFDPVNLISSLEDVYESGRLMSDCWSTAGPYFAPCAHAKDVRIGAELSFHLWEEIPGRGELDFGAFFEVCQKLGDGAAVVVEHLGPDEAQLGLEFIKEAGRVAGISFD